MNRPGFWSSAGKWSLVIVMTAPLLLPALVIAPVAPRASARLLRLWAAAARSVFGIVVECVDHNAGRYPAGAYLFVSLNQTSLAETIVTPEVLPRPVAVFANLEYALLPLVGWLMVAQGGVVVIRQWRAQARRAVDRAIARSKRGRSFYMSIEGRRSPDGALQPYKKGAAVLAIASGATVVPLVMHGMREVLPLGEWRVRPGRVRVELLEALDPISLGYDDRDRLTTRLRGLAEASLGTAARSVPS